jgi:putative Ca2+/H+ antiporter (TMEM165/GDT1 family)
MDAKIIISTFIAVFLAELGDKTQLAILGLAAESKTLVPVFIGAAAAMMFATLLAVVFGSFIAAYVPEKVVHVLAGAAFIVVGMFMLVGKL